MFKIVLWVYLVVLCVGGLFGYLKAGSVISLITSAAFAVPLALCALDILPRWTAYVLTGFLGAFFLFRLIKSGKFMPAGLMAMVSILALVLLLVL